MDGQDSSGPDLRDLLSFRLEPVRDTPPASPRDTEVRWHVEEEEHGRGRVPLVRPRRRKSGSSAWSEQVRRRKLPSRWRGRLQSLFPTPCFASISTTVTESWVTSLDGCESTTSGSFRETGSPWSSRRTT